jgi:ferric-dicitrate binding protein FerR (iron transport regulator)
MRLPGIRATAAPMKTWPVNRPRNSGAWRKDLLTLRSAPMASLMA